MIQTYKSISTKIINRAWDGLRIVKNRKKLPNPMKRSKSVSISSTIWVISKWVWRLTFPVFPVNIRVTGNPWSTSLRGGGSRNKLPILRKRNKPMSISSTIRIIYKWVLKLIFPIFLGNIKVIQNPWSIRIQIPSLLKIMIEMIEPS